MIIWVNGPFGAGKTATSHALVEMSAGLRAFDPETVGYLLAHHLGDHEFSDFQQLLAWRRLVPKVADELVTFTGQRLVAAQTVLVEDYWHELRDGLRSLGHEVCHVLLDADESALRVRINADTVEVRARQWRLEHIETYRQARPWMLDSADIVVDTSRLSPPQAAGQARNAVLQAGYAE